MTAHRVRALLMGGQACVLYGAAEFSRDLDLAILADSVTWKRLGRALADLQAERIYVPPAELGYLIKGHALHFRCRHPDMNGERVDVLSVMRGVDAFSKLWKRRITLQDGTGTIYELLSLPDLVQAKKTQRDKDWPMIRRLVEVDYFGKRARPTVADVQFWLLELRTPELLLELTRDHLKLAQRLAAKRPLLKGACQQNESMLTEALDSEEKKERERDRLYWKPLKKELERLRHLEGHSKR
jgi:hypothetical protein